MMKSPSLKTLIKTVSACVFNLLIAMQVLAENSLSTNQDATIFPLINALKTINHPVSEKAAEALSSLGESESGYDLHLRNAGLNINQIELIAAAIKTVHDNGGPSLQSFSMSYNPKLGDEGVLVLVENLPHTITEIGLVRSNVGDKGAKALIEWAKNAKKLRELCIEENIFSNDIKKTLAGFAQERRGLLVVY